MPCAPLPCCAGSSYRRPPASPRPSLWCWWLRNAALSYEMHRQLEGTVEAEDLSHTAGNKGREEVVGTPATWPSEETRARAGTLRQGPASHYRVGQPPGAVVMQATRDCTVKTVQKAAD